MEREQGTVSIAFLDVLSSGLGATVMLFVIFAILDAPGSPDSTTKDGLDLVIPSTEAHPDSPDEPKPRPGIYRLLVAATEASEPPNVAMDWLTCPAESEGPIEYKLVRTPNEGLRQSYLLRLSDTTVGKRPPVDIMATTVCRVIFEVAGGYGFDQDPVEIPASGSLQLTNRGFEARDR